MRYKKYISIGRFIINQETSIKWAHCSVFFMTFSALIWAIKWPISTRMFVMKEKKSGGLNSAVKSMAPTVEFNCTTFCCQCTAIQFGFQFGFSILKDGAPYYKFPYIHYIYWIFTVVWRMWSWIETKKKTYFGFGVNVARFYFVSVLNLMSWERCLKKTVVFGHLCLWWQFLAPMMTLSG